MTRGRRAGERGAALLEALLALGIAAMLAAGAAGVSRFGLTVVERAGASSARAADATALRRSLADALAHMEPEGATGSASALDWRGATPAAEGWRSGDWRLAGPGATLHRCEGPGVACRPETTLSDAPLRLAYAGADGIWRDDWTATQAPSLIRATVGAAEIVVAPRAMGLGR